MNNIVVEELLNIGEISSKPELLETISKGQGALEQSNFSLYLYRFISRQNRVSSVVDSEYTKIILQLIADSNLMVQISKLAQQNLRILRMQLNIMREGGFVDRHIDYDRDPAYVSSVMIQVGSEYSGGNFIIYNEDGKSKVIHRTNRSIMVMSSLSPHKVEHIQKGFRYTVCLFCGL
jgi:predicted 2-oxoglutarate/Fe(II)-dependent dioxygenase YbiX